ncbi:MAG TPA: beta-ketoacyl synthase N-terminal-like domain-containing protein [Candidatus Kryptobacter bacterium]|nr:beta-ketoacyl synthase N-terminal-like domain-containing protein [Candidatus Kryptobacter bacterium]
MSKSGDHIAITGMGSISPLGYSPDEVWQSYLRRESLLKPRLFNDEKVPVASLQKPSEDILKAVRIEETFHKHLDRTVLMAMHCARAAVEQAGWERSDGGSRTGVNIGSSRGATGILEESHGAYLRNPSQRIFPLTSPITTLGNISSTVAHDIGANGPKFSHSVTCSSALHAVFNGIAWMRGGLADRFVVGGAEAPLTGFTVAQMKALRIYTNDIHSEYPSRPCSSETPLRDTMALGEGAALFALEKLTTAQLSDKKRSVLGVIESFGYGLESPSTATSITEDGLALRNSMTMALKGMASGDSVDMIILHAPGTIKGDRSELNAIKITFGGKLPVLVSNKWFVGHTFGASAALSLEYALLILSSEDYIDFPYPVAFENPRRPIRKIMINAAGFGGNAASLIVSKPTA